MFALKHGIRPAREEPLVLLGPKGLRAFLGKLAEAHGAFVTEPGFPVEVVELEESGRWQDPAGRLALAWHPTPHTDTSLAYRVEASQGDVGYTGDTGPSDAVADFLSSAALLIAECSLEDPPSMDTHLSPRTLGRMAIRAAPDLLLVTHLYPPLRAHRIPELLRSAGYPGEALVAQDGMAVEVSGGSARLREG
jgi:phosphoribosyl 1,2-cyclic phosphodiesterase